LTKERVLLKISGESFGGKQNIFDRNLIYALGEEVKSCVEIGYQIAILPGGGNIVRGDEQKENFPELKNSDVPDYIGMLSTIQNGLFLQEILELVFKLETRVMSALDGHMLYEQWIPRKADHHLKRGRVIILVGGTANPGFSTDMAMVIRARQIHASFVLKGTKVEGIYDKDPKNCPDAVFVPQISYSEYVEKQLKIVNTPAVEQARKYQMKIRVFDLFKKGNLKRILTQNDIGSVIQ